MSFKRVETIEHKAKQLEVEMSNDANLTCHIRKHVAQNENEFWNEWADRERINSLNEELDKMGCIVRKYTKECTRICSTCTKLEECYKIIEKCGLSQIYSDLIFCVLHRDLNEGPRHTHHINNEKKREEMYYLGTNGIFIVIEVSKKSCHIISAYRCDHPTLGVLGSKIIEIDVRYRYQHFIDNAQSKVRKKIKEGRITINRWCNRENWGMENEN